MARPRSSWPATRIRPRPIRPTSGHLQSRNFPSRASVVVSKFATLRYRSPSELRNQNDTRNQYVASVLSIPKFAKRRYRDVANFGIGTLELFAFCWNRPPSSSFGRHLPRTRGRKTLGPSLTFPPLLLRGRRPAGPEGADQSRAPAKG